MTVSALILRATRALHNLSVRTHVKALRLSVLAADARAELSIQLAKHMLRKGS